MTLPRDEQYRNSLVQELTSLPAETGWLEFKRNNTDTREIGEYISALSNAAAFAGKPHAYMLWGIADGSHAIVGTDFHPTLTKVGNEELESWLLRQLSPRIGFRFHRVELEAGSVVLLEIDSAFRHPVQFAGAAFIRIGSYKKRLADFPEQERALWRTLDATPFELQSAGEKLGGDEVLRLLDVGALFDLLDKPMPNGRDATLEALASHRLVEPMGGSHWRIFNLGALLFAKRLSDFGRLQRKAVRVVVYQGTGRVLTLREQEGGRGYAGGFEGLIGFVNNLLPVNEVIGKALRKSVPMYPELAIRELVANALIHQDLAVTGSGPMVEIFDDRMEITNPGAPLMEPERMLDHPPRSRNEALAALMRLIGVCEERGSGVDKVVFQTELYQLPAPAFEVVGESTRATLFAPRPLAGMMPSDRVRAVYLHACLRYVQRQPMTNASLRDRFGIDPKNSATASRLLKEALDAGQIRLEDAAAPPKLRRYVPRWA
jgi:ATP-dependent DNA helicase RecG